MLKRYSLFQRKSKVDVKDFCTPFFERKFFEAFIDSLPDILAAKNLRTLLQRCQDVKKEGARIVVGMGAHMIKCGLAPLLIEGVKRGVFDAFCMNGAVLVHDVEIAYCGKTSEDVAEGIKDGSFGMVRESPDFINECIREAASEGITIPHSVGRKIAKEDLSFKEKSLLFHLYKESVKATAHIGIGTDIVHMHPLSAEDWGKAAFHDFLEFVEIVKELERGVFLNFGSAVIIPEVFIKAVSMARNMIGRPKKITCANFDMFFHYRPNENIVKRPTQAEGAFGCYIIGHHEIMAPLFLGALISFLGGN